MTTTSTDSDNLTELFEAAKSPDVAKLIKAVKDAKDKLTKATGDVEDAEQALKAGIPPVLADFLNKSQASGGKAKTKAPASKGDASKVNAAKLAAVVKQNPKGNKLSHKTIAKELETAPADVLAFLRKNEDKYATDKNFSNHYVTAK